MAKREYGTGEHKLSSDQRLKLGKFISAEMHAEKKKEPSKRRKQDQVLAIGYSKLNSGEL